ncbi:MAG: aminodeoxychorismate synthase component I [Arcobacteraceae bacterium]|nr:aminodeoxychorismate synthase component I [Arcobacteraceae bacterium]
MNQTFQEKLNYYGSLKEPFFFMISYDLTQSVVCPLKKLPPFIKYEINKKVNSSNQNLVLKKYPMAFKTYQKKFQALQEQIRAGNSYLLNLTAKTRIETALSLDEIYDKAASKFKLQYKDQFVCFSPEQFVQIKNNTIFTFPMKGTIDAKIKNAKQLILNNEKEKAEHIMVVDLLRNDLSIVAKKVRVKKFRYVESLQAGNKTLLQVSSKIEGTLPKNWHEMVGDIIIKLLPAGSITGTPKKKTVEILKGIEKYNRGFYTGIFGVYDGKNLNSAVMIRFIEKSKNNRYFYKSGGGITCDSDCFSEYQELIDKIYIPS